MNKLNIILMLLFSFQLAMAQEGFPQKPVDNTEAEGKRYEKEKTEWIKTHQDEYINMGGQLVKKTDVIKDETGEKALEIKRDKPENTPKLTDAERIALDKAKMEWIKHNPEEYKKMGGTLPTGDSQNNESEITTGSQNDNAANVKHETIDYADLPKSAVLWKLSKIEIIENGNIDETLDQEQEAFVQEFSKRKMRIYVNGNEMNEVYISQGNNQFMKFRGSKKNQIITPQVEDCDECDAYALRIIEQDNTSIILEQDKKSSQGKTFVARYYFSF